MTTSWTQTDIEALEAAIKRGVLSVRFSDREVRYQSTSEMLKALQTMRDAIEVTESTSASRTTYASFRKGPNG